MKQVLTIAGSDSTGGGGIQADLKTFEEYGVFGFSSLTCIVTMDPAAGWSHAVAEIPTDLLEKQLISVFAGEIDALKTGMMGNEDNIKMAERYIKKYNMQKVVIDPVIACKGTANILQPKSVEALQRNLIPHALITTPNLIEAGILSELGDLSSVEMMKEAARKIHLLGAKNVVVKGGSRLKGNEAVDVFYDGNEYTVLRQPILAQDTNHGAGCTFAAAITAGLAKGASVKDSVMLAKNFVRDGIQNGIHLNPYVGHVWHGGYNKAEHRVLPEIK